MTARYLCLKEPQSRLQNSRFFFPDSEGTKRCKHNRPVENARALRALRACEEKKTTVGLSQKDIRSDRGFE